MTTPPALQPLEDWPERVCDREGRDLAPGFLVRVLDHEGRRSHDGHVVDCRKVEADGTAWLCIWQDDRDLSPHNTMFLIRKDEDDGTPRRWSGEENDTMAKKTPKKSGKKTTKASAPKRRVKKQQSIPETQEPEIEELESIAAELSHQHQEQMSAKNACSLLRGRMMAAMQRHGRTLYECDGVRFEIVAGDDKLKLKMLDRDGDDASDDAEAAE